MAPTRSELTSVYFCSEFRKYIYSGCIQLASAGINKVGLDKLLAVITISEVAIFATYVVPVTVSRFVC